MKSLFILYPFLRAYLTSLLICNVCWAFVMLVIIKWQYLFSPETQWLNWAMFITCNSLLVPVFTLLEYNIQSKLIFHSKE